MTDKALEAALKAFDPMLFGDDPTDRHKAASPYTVESAQAAPRMKMQAAISAYLSALPWDAKIPEWAERERDGAIGKWEAADGMDGAVVHAIRELLNAQNVPLSAFIDDHVANAIRQRNTAEAHVKDAMGLLDHLIGWIVHDCGAEPPFTSEQDETYAALCAVARALEVERG